MNKLMLNLGCGSVRPINWVNTDSSINAHLQRIPLIGKKLASIINNISYSNNNIVYMNLNNKWKYKDNTVDIVYASHLFEHLSVKASILFLSEAYRCLKPGGIIRIVVPDLYQICKKYTIEYELNDSMDKNIDTTTFIMWAINMHREGQYKKLNLFKKLVLEIQGYPHQHKYMYDKNSLILKLKNNNFHSFKNLSYGKSLYINNINEVEGQNESYLSIYIEAIK
jgi:predicted SAM-dependent methyltransferase